MEIRELTTDDWLALRELRLHALRTELGLFFKHPDEEASLPEDHWRAWAAGGEERQVFGLFDGERLVGITGTFRDADDPTGATVGFGMTYLSPEYRGRGFASRFYEARFAWVRARPHVRRVTVGHRRSNDASRRTIEKFGFRWIANIPHRWPDGTDDDDVCYELLVEDLQGSRPASSRSFGRDSSRTEERK
jgi:RimJ/RimL family protein N-acetyltransferase